MSYLRLLFWLKWTLMWRAYRRDRSAVLGIILSVIFFLPMALFVAFGCAVGFLSLEPPNNEHLLRGMLLGVYLFWLLSPLIGYALNESYDITKLFLYPLSVRQIFVGAIVGSLMDFPVLLLLPTLLAVLVGFTQSVFAFVLVLIPVVLFLFHTLSLSQALVLASAGVLRSRRFRDILMIVIPLFWMGYYVLTQTLSRQAVDWARFLPAFLNSRTWDLINFLPPGLAARAIAAAGRGEYVLALVFLLGLGVFTVGTVYLAGWLVQMVYLGEVISAPVRRRAAPAPESTSPPTTKPAQPLSKAPFAWSALPGLRLLPVVAAVMDKELKYLFRDPYFKVVLMNLVYMLVIFVFAFVWRPGRSAAWQGFAPGALWGVTGWVLLSEMSLLFNIFGTEGGAALVLFLFPSSRRQMLIGKNLTLFVALSVVNFVLMTTLILLSGAWRTFGPLLCWMALALVVFIAVGNLVSIWFPFRVVMRGWRIRQQSAGRGCGYGFLYMGVSAVAFLLLLPVLAALMIPSFWVSPAWFALTVPFAFIYASGLYALSLHLAEPLLLQREVDIIEKVGEEE